MNKLLFLGLSKITKWNEVEDTVYSVWEKSPLIGRGKVTPRSYYTDLFDAVKNKQYSEIDRLENEIGFAINKKWFSELAFHTQIVKKKTPINYQHGRVLYSVLRGYIKDSKVDSLNILETGTARGFSTLCMAKAIEDSGAHGKVVTLDVLPHNVPIYWNCIDDSEGKKTRKQLLSNYGKLIDRYIIFFQNYSEIGLKRLDLGRVHFAYLDGQHTYNTIVKEVEYVANRQKKGDLIVFDDYDQVNFPGVVEGVNKSVDKFGYSVKTFKADKDESRFYLKATKK